MSQSAHVLPPCASPSRHSSLHAVATHAPFTQPCPDGHVASTHRPLLHVRVTSNAVQYAWPLVQPSEGPGPVSPPASSVGPPASCWTAPSTRGAPPSPPPGACASAPSSYPCEP